MTLSRYLTKLSPLPEKLQCLFRTVDKEIFCSNSFLKGKFLYIQVYYCSLLCSSSAHHHRQHQKTMKSFQILSMQVPKFHSGPGGMLVECVPVNNSYSPCQ